MLSTAVNTHWAGLQIGPHAETAVGCGDLFREAWSLWEMPPCHKRSAAWPVFLARLYFVTFKICLWSGVLFCRWRIAAVGALIVVCGVSNLQRDACNSWSPHFKMCIYEFKITNTSFFLQISPVTSWSFNSPTNKTVPVKEAILWDSFWMLFREISVGFLSKLVRA